MLQDTGISVLTDARYPDWMADRPYRNAFDLSVLHMKPQMIKARLADSSKVHNCACTPLANGNGNVATSETGNLSLSLSRHGCHKLT